MFGRRAFMIMRYEAKNLFWMLHDTSLPTPFERVLFGVLKTIRFGMRLLLAEGFCWMTSRCLVATEVAPTS